MPDDAKYVLIAAQSGRPLASAARRAGYTPLVADVFGDLDTLEIAHRHVTLARDAAGAIARESFDAALAALMEGIDPEAIAGIVCGSGFEDRTELLEAAARRAPLIGNAPDIVRGLKDPLRFARLCATLDIAHPTITFDPPREPAGWLVKQAGASGGAHAHAAQAGERARTGRYFQRAAAGETISALFCADGRAVQIVGFSAQWTSGDAARPFQYGGAAGPLAPAPALARQLTTIIQGVTRTRRLRGLCSADFIVDGDLVWLIEVNPRPGATLDVFDSDVAPLLAAHVSACSGVFLPAAPPPRGARAAAVAYASRAIAAMPAIDWPAWTADRQTPGTPLTDGAPICTVLGEGATLKDARASAMERLALIKEVVDWNA